VENVGDRKRNRPFGFISRVLLNAANAALSLVCLHSFAMHSTERGLRPARTRPIWGISQQSLFF
jgi:hypothetical protein